MTERTASGGAELIVLSAADRATLHVQCERLLGVLVEEPDLALADVAHTLQVGREALDERVAMLVATTQELQRLLAAYLAAPFDRGAEAGVWSGRAGSSGLDGLLFGESGDAIVALLVERGELGKLAALWVHGATVPWSALPRAGAARVISLPGYAFTGSRHWIVPRGMEAPRR